MIIAEPNDLEALLHGDYYHCAEHLHILCPLIVDKPLQVCGKLLVLNPLTCHYSLIVTKDIRAKARIEVRDTISADSLESTADVIAQRLVCDHLAVTGRLVIAGEEVTTQVQIQNDFGRVRPFVFDSTTTLKDAIKKVLDELGIS